MSKFRRVVMHFNNTMMRGRKINGPDENHTHVKEGFKFQAIGGDNFRLEDVIAATSRGRTISPTVYLIGDIVDKGESGILELVVTGVPGDSGLAGAVQLAILSMFPENMRDRINIECWGGSIASVPSFWSSNKAIFQLALTPFNGVTLKYVDEYAEIQYIEPEINGMLDTIFRTAEKFTFTETQLAPESNLKLFDRKLMNASRERSTKIRTIMGKSSNKVMFDGVIMSPGTFNGYTFSADVLKQSEKYWQGNPIVINHEDETMAETAILGRQYRAWWNQDIMALETLGEVTEPTMVGLMADKDFKPDMSVGIEMWVDENDNVMDLRPFHLAFLISYAPANPAAGVKNIIKE